MKTCGSWLNVRRSTLHILMFVAVWNPVFGQGSPPDYSNPFNWAVLPPDTVLYDLFAEDAVQTERLFEDSLNSRGIDVFYVYPTLLTSKTDRRSNYNIDDPAHRREVTETAVRFQASAWAGCGRMFVPYYRQAHYRSYRKFDKGGREALELAYEDVKASFQYYLDSFYTGGGIILAGHSQGTTHLSVLLSEFFDGKELGNKLVAAYLPGIGLPENRYINLKLMTRPEETGGFVTWNTCKRHYNRRAYRAWYKGKACINPVSWDTSSLAPRDRHKGFLYSDGKLYRNSFDTHRVDGAIWISLPDFPKKFQTIFMKNYHVGDINLFWEDIRRNACLRAERWREG